MIYPSHFEKKNWWFHQLELKKSIISSQIRPNKCTERDKNLVSKTKQDKQIARLGSFLEPS